MFLNEIQKAKVTVLILTDDDILSVKQRKEIGIISNKTAVFLRVEVGRKATNRKKSASNVIISS